MTSPQAEGRDAELLARLRGLPDDARRCLIEWLSEAERDALTHDPSVGIFASTDMAEGFRILDQLVGSGESGRPVPDHGSGQ